MLIALQQETIIARVVEGVRIKLRTALPWLNRDLYFRKNVALKAGLAQIWFGFGAKTS